MASTLIMPEVVVERTLRRLAYEIIERNRGSETIELVGIRKRGTALARTIAAYIGEAEGVEVRVHQLDVERYRDDRQSDAPDQSVVTASLADRDVILVDDVLYTGRTVRAALDAVLRYGRPRSIQLVVLVDRGHREYPVQADYVGKYIPTKHRERVVVAIEDTAEVRVIEE